MEPDDKPSWQPTRNQVLTILGVVLLATVIILFGGYVLGWGWTGFAKQKLWDWLDLLIVPIVLAIGGYLFNRSENSRSQKVADQRSKVDRDTAEKRAQDDALESYLDDMRELLIDDKRSSHWAQGGNSLRGAMARARTLTVLTRLDGGRKGSVVWFLSELNLIDKKNPFVKLGGMRRNISGGGSSVATRGQSAGTAAGVDEYALTIGGAKLSEIDLQGADLRATDLSYVDLSYAKLNAADLTNADLSFTILVGADLMHAKLQDATLDNAILQWANLYQASIADEQIRRLDDRGALTGAVMKNGSRPSPPPEVTEFFKQNPRHQLAQRHHQLEETVRQLNQQA